MLRHAGWKLRRRRTFSQPTRLSFPIQRVLPMHRPEKHATIPWHFAVMLEDVSETGERFELVADPDTRAAIARTAELRDLPRLEASFEVRRQGVGGLRVTGRVSA